MYDKICLAQPAWHFFQAWEFIYFHLSGCFDASDFLIGVEIF